MSALLAYKCPHCGGSIGFDSASQQMKCPYCESDFDVETLRQLDQEEGAEGGDDFQWQAYEGGRWQQGELEGIHQYICNSCGGEILCDATTAATHCPYCDNATIVEKQVSGLLKPDFVIPFQLDRQAAGAALTKHYQGKPLLPRQFRQGNRVQELTGLYVPFWLYDCDASAHMRFRATRVKTWSDSKYNYTKTDYYSLIRDGNARFQRIPADGSQKMSDAFMDSIEPYRYEGLKEFNTGYLSGFLADKYDVDAQACKPRINERVKNSIEASLRSTISGYSSSSVEHSSVQLAHGQVSYALMPVWMFHTKYKDKLYTFATNGQTGKLAGDLPVSWGLFWLWLTGLFAAISAAAVPLALWMDISNLLIPLGISLIIALCIVLGMKSQMKSVRQKTTATDYMKSFDLTLSRDTFLYSRVTKHARPQENRK